MLLAYYEKCCFLKVCANRDISFDSAKLTRKHLVEPVEWYFLHFRTIFTACISTIFPACISTIFLHVSVKVQSTQRTLQQLEVSKHEVDAKASRLEKDRVTLRKTVERVDRVRQQSEEVVSRLTLERGEMEVALRRLDEENKDVHRQCQCMQQHVQQIETQHSQKLMELTVSHRNELGSLSLSLSLSPFLYIFIYLYLITFDIWKFW